MAASAGNSKWGRIDYLSVVVDEQVVNTVFVDAYNFVGEIGTFDARPGGPYAFGQHTVRLWYVVGDDGLWASSRTYSVTVQGDETEPELMLFGELAERDGDYVGAGVVPFDVTAEDIEGSGIRSVTLAANGGEVESRPVDCTGGCPAVHDERFEIDTRHFAEGELRLAVSAEDAAGNRSPADEISVLVDRTAPTLPTRVRLREFDASAQTISLDWMEGDDPDLSPDLLGAGQAWTDARWRKASGAWSAWRRVQGSDMTLDGIRENDQIDVELRSVDAVGNESAPISATLVVRPDPPASAAPTPLADDPGACTPRIDYTRAASLRPHYRLFRKVETMLNAQLNVYCIIRDGTYRVEMTANFYVKTDDGYRLVGNPSPGSVFFRPRNFWDVKVRGIQALCMPNMAGTRNYIIGGKLKYWRTDPEADYEREFEIHDEQSLRCPVEAERRRREVRGWSYLTRWSPDQSDDTKRSARAQLRRSLGSEPYKPRGVKNAWHAHHIIPVNEDRAAALQALLFRCQVHPNDLANGVYLRGAGLRRTRDDGSPNPAYEALRQYDEALAARTYHFDTRRTEYFVALNAVFANALNTHTERCPDGHDDVVGLLTAVGGNLKAGEFPVGSPRN